MTSRQARKRRRTFVPCRFSPRGRLLVAPVARATLPSYHPVRETSRAQRGNTRDEEQADLSATNASARTCTARWKRTREYSRSKAAQLKRTASERTGGGAFDFGSAFAAAGLAPPSAPSFTASTAERRRKERNKEQKRNAARKSARQQRTARQAELTQHAHDSNTHDLTRRKQ